MCDLRMTGIVLKAAISPSHITVQPRSQFYFFEKLIDIVYALPIPASSRFLIPSRLTRFSSAICPRFVFVRSTSTFSILVFVSAFFVSEIKMNLYPGSFERTEEAPIDEARSMRRASRQFIRQNCDSV
jgi:hypothetical protein